MFCNSHYVSQFAAFFIGARAKTSIAASYVLVLVFFMCSPRERRAHSCKRFKGVFCRSEWRRLLGSRGAKQAADITVQATVAAREGAATRRSCCRVWVCAARRRVRPHPTLRKEGKEGAAAAGARAQFFCLFCIALLLQLLLLLREKSNGKQKQQKQTTTHE